MTPYPLTAVRSLALHTQGLTTPLGTGALPTPSAINEVVERVGCVQIDTLHMVRRSHYVVVWSRLGSYDPADFDRLVYDPESRLLFEGWQHVASIIPLKDYRYQMPLNDRLRYEPSDWFKQWLAQEVNSELLPSVLERIRQEGALRAADFEYHGPRRGSWWDWKPAKTALEFLYSFGDLMIADRKNFQRVYDLTERILPKWVDTRKPSAEERDRFWIEQGARALGICQPMQAADYSYRKRTQVKSLVEAIMAEGVLVPVEATLADGNTHSLVVHRDNLELLQQAAEGDIRTERTTFLSPFDSLFWGRGRDEQFWGFRNRLEAYKRAPDRVWGYYCLPILHRDRLVGRFDPKLERQAGLLRLKALYLEAGIAPEEELIADVATAMRDFLAFHGAKDLVVEKSQPEEFGVKLLKAL
jgi:uncharacterized protein